MRTGRETVEDPWRCGFFPKRQQRDEQDAGQQRAGRKSQYISACEEISDHRARSPHRHDCQPIVQQRAEHCVAGRKEQKRQDRAEQQRRPRVPQMHIMRAIIPDSGTERPGDKHAKRLPSTRLRS